MISLHPDNSLRRLTITIAFLLGAFCCVEFSSGQETDGSSTEERYNKAVSKGRELVKVCRNISLRFFDGSLAESYEWKEKWSEASKVLADHRPVLEKSAIDWFLECEEPPQSLVQIAMVASNEVYQAGDIELAFKMLEKLRRLHPEKEPMLEHRFALAAIKTNRFELGLQFLKDPDAKDILQEIESQLDENLIDNKLDKNLFLLCPLLAQTWNREAEIRDKEAKADDLPRVKFQLTTGEVTLELFENEAPQTVANFINLVESGFYDDSYCHPMVKNVVVQAGLMNRSQNARLGYVIKNESRLPESRHHFTGSLSMVSSEGANAGNTASSTFSVTLLPNPDLDWDRTDEDELSQTVFGRVVSGMEHVMALPPTIEFDEETEQEKPIKGVEPGVIEKATVIRKRDHDYKFEKLKPPKK